MDNEDDAVKAEAGQT